MERYACTVTHKSAWRANIQHWLLRWGETSRNGAEPEGHRRGCGGCCRGPRSSQSCTHCAPMLVSLFAISIQERHGSALIFETENSVWLIPLWSFELSRHDRRQILGEHNWEKNHCSMEKCFPHHQQGAALNTERWRNCEQKQLVRSSLSTGLFLTQTLSG